MRVDASQLIVASIQEDWEEKIDEDTNKPYYVHAKTGESSWEDADERYDKQLTQKLNNC